METITMGILLDTNYFQYRLGWVLRFVRYFIIIYMIVLSGLLLYALIDREIFLLFLMFTVLGPLGLLTFVFYHLLQNHAIRTKTRKLALILENSTNYLDQIPRRITEYDIDITMETHFVWKNVLSPFLIAVVRFMVDAKNKIISEESGRNRDWSTDLSPDSPPMMLSNYTKSIARAIRDRDSVAAFEAIGELLAFPFYYDNQKRRREDGLIKDDFIKLCREITKLLRKRRLLEANDLVNKLILDLRDKGSANIEEAKWQLLIAHWVNLRVIFLNYPTLTRLSWLWIEPIKLLSAQLDAVIDAYNDKDFSSIAEIVNESFDWRTRIPRFVQ
jgi:hypothetical protein